jgi:two-component system, OmpR family, sensor histidine kinase QseC
VKSIRLYLIVALLAAVTLGNFVAAVYGYRSSLEEVETLLDTQLADTAALIQTMRPARNAVSVQPSDRLAFQIWSANGQLVQRSANSGELPITAFEEGYRDENFEGYRWRVLSHKDEQSGLWLLIAERVDIRVGLADNIVLGALLPIILSLPLIAAIVWLIVGNGLSLIGRLANELSAKRADDLSSLTTENPPQELAPVVNAINDLLRRLNSSVQRERRFSSDAAHELRTPLSAIKVHVHNLKKQFPENAEALMVLDRDLGRLGHLIEQIMLLYRTAPEHYQATMQDVDLYALAQSVIGELFDDVERKQQNISLHGSPQTIVGDKPSLIILLTNLIQNASKYSPEGASIAVTVDREDLGLLLGVTDSGPGIPLTEINNVFDRFRRVGGDRHGSTVDGCGLGLSIARHIADLHQATINLQNNDRGQGLTVSVLFPADIRVTTGTGVSH